MVEVQDELSEFENIARKNTDATKKVQEQSKVAQEQSKVAQSKFELVANGFNEINEAVKRLSDSQRAEIKAEYDAFMKAYATLEKDKMNQEFYLNYIIAFSRLNEKIQKSTIFTKEEKQKFNGIYVNFMREVMPLLMNEAPKAPALKNTYIEEDVVKRWFEEYIRNSEAFQKAITDDFLLRISYVSEVVRQSALNMMEGKPLDDTAKEVLQKENAWGLLYGTNIDGITFKEAVPVIIGNNKA
ncbi:MAG: hypothetical protein N3H30_02390 [Candidatus Micrarchaeota archaeon]|nr:hypothetical protein [Candidatus Micrarchaeota archaeon]